MRIGNRSCGRGTSAGLVIAVAACALLHTACNEQIQPGQFASNAGGRSGGTKGGGGSNSVVTSTKTGSQSSDSGTGGPSKTAGKQGTAGGDATTSSGAAGDSSGSSSGAAGATSSTGNAGGAAAPKPANFVDACVDKAGTATCDGTTLYNCGDAGAYMKRDACKTPAQCMAGVMTGICGTCDPGVFKCDEAMLTKCDETGTWKMQETCASADLCKEAKGVCDTMVCAAEELRCKGDELQVCNDALTEFQSKQTCQPGMCDGTNTRCNECVPMSKTCDSTSSLTLCTADGKKMPTACSGDTKLCDMATNACVQCLAATDCPPSTNDCGTVACNAGKCGAGTPKPLKTKCASSVSGSGVCDLAGNCVGCITDDDCGDASKRCNPLNVFTPCEARDPISASAGLGGTYSVTVAPGFSVSVDPPGTAVVTKNLIQTVTQPIPASSDAVTYTIRVDGMTGACGDLFSMTGKQNIVLTFGNSAVLASDGSGKVMTEACTMTTKVTLNAIGK